MKDFKKNYFRYWIKDGWTAGYFNIYQAKNGSIMMSMANTKTVLTYRQISDLFLDCYALIDFDHDLFQSFYKQQIETKQIFNH